MSVNDQHDANGPVTPGSPLARALDEFAVAGLSAGFADRVVAAAQARPAPLPDLRRASGGRGWWLGRRIAIGAASFGALATAAAATGLLERLDVPVPSAQTVWASLTGEQPVVAAAAVPALPTPVSIDPVALSPVEIVGPIDTPEELGEAFRRIDEVRQGRREVRRELIDHRITREIERRRAAGLPLPSPEEVNRLRQRADESQSRRQQRADEQVRLRREEMARKVESGEALTREDVLRPLRRDARDLEQDDRLEQLRRLSPDERRAALRQLPTEQRRALVEDYRARRAWSATPASGDALASAPTETAITTRPKVTATSPSPPAPARDGGSLPR